MLYRDKSKHDVSTWIESFNFLVIPTHAEERCACKNIFNSFKFVDFFFSPLFHLCNANCLIFTHAAHKCNFLAMSHFFIIFIFLVTGKLLKFFVYATNLSFYSFLRRNFYVHILFLMTTKCARRWPSKKFLP
jgi:hypothetical protein